MAGAAKFFYKGPDSKYLRLCKPYRLCCNYSPPLLYVTIRCYVYCRQNINEWVWICSNGTLFTKQAAGPQILVCHLLSIWESPAFRKSLFEALTVDQYGCCRGDDGEAGREVSGELNTKLQKVDGRHLDAETREVAA